MIVLLTGCSSGGSNQAQITSNAGNDSTVSTSTTFAARRSAPRWETVATVSGKASQNPPSFEILRTAIQWRIRWSCDEGSLRITSTPPPKRGGPLVDVARCPQKGEAFAIFTGPVRLSITASSPWKAIVDQQLDTALNEPLAPDVAAVPVVARGSFYPIERDGRGSVRLHQLPGGRRVLRFEDFEVSQNTDLFVWLSEAPEPRTSVEALRSPKVVIGNLKSTLGNQSYEVPADLPTSRLRSVVIWCEPVAIAYSAASLES